MTVAKQARAQSDVKKIQELIDEVEMTKKVLPNNKIN
jgi:hypothetical protein